MIVESIETWGKKHHKGINYDPQDKYPSPVVGYHNMSHWTKDLTCMRYSIPYWVRLGAMCPQLKRAIDFELSLIEKTDKDRPYFFLLRLAKRLLETGLTVRELGALFEKTPETVLTHHMAMIIKKEYAIKND